MKKKTSYQIQKIKQRLFIFMDSKNQSENERVQLIVNPQMLKILFDEYKYRTCPEKKQLLQQISQIYNYNSNSSLLLFKRDQEIRDHNISILDDIIQFIFSIEVPREENKQLAQQFETFINSYPLSSKNIKKITNILSLDFYSGTFSPNKINLAILLLKKCFETQVPKKNHPSCYFFMYGENSGIKLIKEKNLWMFPKGFSLNISFLLKRNFRNSELMYLRVKDSEFYLTISQYNVLYIKAFGDCDQFEIMKLKQNTWYYLKMEYLLKNYIFKKVFNLKISINQKSFEKESLPIPDINQQDQIAELVFGRDLHGKINSIFLSREQDHNEIFQNTDRFWIESWVTIQSIFKSNKKMYDNLQLLYLPFITTEVNNKTIIYDVISRKHGELLENTTLFINQFLTTDINYYGGLYNLLPLFYLIRFYNANDYPTLLQDVLSLILSIFESQYRRLQEQAINCKFFDIIGVHIAQINPKFINVNIIKLLTQLKSYLKETVLKEKYFKFLWKINIKEIFDENIINNLFQLIKSFYQLNLNFYLKIFDIEHILHYTSENYEPIQIQKCCLQHYIMENRDFNQKQQIGKNYDNDRLEPTIKLIFYITETLLKQDYNEGIQSIQLILNFFCNERSKCFTLFLIEILSKIYNELTIKNLKLDMKKKCHIYNYLFLILNRQTCYDIVTSCITFLYHIYYEDQQKDSHENKKIIYEITRNLQKLNTKNQQHIKARSISDSYNDGKNYDKFGKSRSLEQCEQNIIEEMKLFKLKKKNITNYKKLFEVVEDLYLVRPNKLKFINDQAVLILIQYFRLCTFKFKIDLISHLKDYIESIGIDLRQQILKNYYNLFYFLLNILTEIDFSKEIVSNKIIQKDIYKILLLFTESLLDNSEQLYKFYLKIQSIIIIIQKQKQSLNIEHLQTIFNCKYIMRKYLAELLKHQSVTQDRLNNIFHLVYLTILCSNFITDVDPQRKILSYFNFLQKDLFFFDKNFLEIHYNLIYLQNQSQILYDLTLIELIAMKYNLDKMNLSDINNLYGKTANYLDYKFSTQFNNIKKNLLRDLKYDQNYGKPKNEGFQFFESLFANSLITNENAEERNAKILKERNICVIQGLILLFSIAIEYCLQKCLFQKFQYFLKQLQETTKLLILIQQNHGTLKKNINKMDEQLSKKIIIQIFHFLYRLLQNQKDISYNQKIQDTIIKLFNFLFINIEIFNSKVGNQDTFIDIIHYSNIIEAVEKYSFFILQLFERNLRDDQKVHILTLKNIKQLRMTNKEQFHEVIFSNKFKQFFKKNKPFVALLNYQINREIVQIKQEFAKQLSHQKSMSTKKLEKQNLNPIVVKDIETIQTDSQNFIYMSQIKFLKEENYNYRQNMYFWNKIWKRLRLYHYPWSIWMNQKQQKNWDWESRKFKNPHIKMKFSKFESNNYTRPILSIRLQQPWHVKKTQIERQLKYITKDYYYNFYKLQEQKNESKSFLAKMFNVRKNLLINQDQFKVQWIINNEKRKGILKLINDKLQFVYESIHQKDSHLVFTNFRLSEYKPLFKNWDLVLITNVSRRRYLMKYQCIEIELENNTYLLFNFLDKRLQQFFNLLNKKQNSKVDPLLKLNKIRFYTEKFNYELNDFDAIVKPKTELWIKRKISNLDYILFLNKVSGRSYYDPTQYPIFPWIISDYTCRELVYRPLEKSMGALGSPRRIQIIKQKTKDNDPFNPVPLYQYGTHYSSPGVIFNFLIRISPYTEAARILQGNKFDISDRLFYSMVWCWKSATNEMSDVRQLTPEFFYLPQFLLNIEYYNLGITQMKQRVHNVQLPFWADGDPYNFITIHRKAFQSDEISNNIQNWIDLIFGYKQKGKIAQQNYNLFYYLTYQNAIDLDKIEDENQKTSIEAQIMHFGQTPTQIFQKPHLKKQEKQKKKFLAHKISNIYKPKIELHQSWDEISEFSRGQQPILCIQLKQDILYIIKCNSLLNFLYEKKEMTLLSQLQLNFKKTKQQIHFSSLTFKNKLQFFGNQYIATGISINGDLRIYNLSGKLLECKPGSLKNCIYVNQKQNLLLTGAKDGLLEVYEIIYQEKQSISLVSIATQYCYDQISHISQGGGYYSVCSGNIVSIYNIIRSAAYVQKKNKKVRCKFLRSFFSKRKIFGAQIISAPLFSIVFYDANHIFSYSINGQKLAKKEISLQFQPKIIKDPFHLQNLICLQEERILILSTPNLIPLRTLTLPSCEFSYWNIFNNSTILIGTSNGQVIVIEQQELIQDA